MIFKETGIKDLVVIEPTVFGDERGYFLESFNESIFLKGGIDKKFIQDNESKSSHGVLRGLHFQVPPFAQSKLVRVVSGEVLDVAVDLRKNSETFGQHYDIILNCVNKKQLFIPQGFAHGFVVRSETAIFSYKVDNFYMPEYELGISWNDEKLNIDWQIDENKILISKRDQNLQSFETFNTPFI